MSAWHTVTDTQIQLLISVFLIRLSLIGSRWH
jgi:hypothetical protein